MTKQERKEKEALRRLKVLENMGLMNMVVEEYEKNKQVFFSEYTGFGGTLFYIDSAPDTVQNKIKELTQKGDVVYHATHERLEFGECWDLFVITEEDIDNGYGISMREDFDNYGLQFAFVINADIPEFSEFGTIGVGTLGGGLVRVS